MMIKAVYIISILFILAGLCIPSLTLIELLRGDSLYHLQEHLIEQLMTGATIFRTGMVLIGVLFIGMGKKIFPVRIIQKTEASSEVHRNTHAILFAGIVIVAISLRLYGLNYGLWYDEIVTYVKYASLPFAEIISTYDSQNQHLLYSVLAHLSLNLFGESAWALRVPAVLFGVASIWAMYLLAGHVMNKREALLSSALLALSYHHIWFSQNARGYTGLLFWALLTSWLLLRAIRGEESHIWFLYAVASALGIYTHMTMVFVLTGHFVMYMIAVFKRRHDDWPDRWRGVLVGFCLTGIFSFQLYSLVLPQFMGTIGSEGTAVSTWKNPLWTFLEFAKGAEISFVGSFSLVIALIIFGAGIWSFRKENPIVLQLLFLPSLIGAGVVIGLGHHLWPRFFFFCFGFAVIVLVRGTMVTGHVIAKIIRLEPGRALPIGTALCIVVILASAVSVYKVYAPKQDFSGAISFVEKEMEAGDTIVTAGMAVIPYKNYYETDWETAETVEDLNVTRSRSRRTWLVYTVPLHLETFHPDIMESIVSDFTVIKKFYGTLSGGAVIVSRADVFHHKKM